MTKRAEIGGTAWVNWNSDPIIHRLGRVEPRIDRVLAKCGTVVRAQLPEPFDPTHPKACERCVADN